MMSGVKSRVVREALGDVQVFTLAGPEGPWDLPAEHLTLAREGNIIEIRRRGEPVAVCHVGDLPNGNRAAPALRGWIRWAMREVTA